MTIFGLHFGRNGELKQAKEDLARACIRHKEACKAVEESAIEIGKSAEKNSQVREEATKLLRDRLIKDSERRATPAEGISL